MKTATALLTICLLLPHLLAAQTVQAHLSNTHPTVLQVWAKPSAALEDAVITYAQFTLRWTSDAAVSLGTITSTYAFVRSGASQQADGYTYQTFAASPTTRVSWRAGQQAVLAEIDVETGPVQQVELAPLQETPGGNGDWYIEVGGRDATNYEMPYYEAPALPVEPDDPVPAAPVRVESAFPNPFHTTTALRFTTRETQPVRVDLFNVLGQHVTTLFDDVAAASTHTVRIDGTNCPPGIYFVRITSPALTQNQRIVLVR